MSVAEPLCLVCFEMHVPNEASLILKEQESLVNIFPVNIDNFYICCQEAAQETQKAEDFRLTMQAKLLSCFPNIFYTMIT